MPVVNISISPQPVDKKAQMVKAVTQQLSNITSIPEEHFVIMINEIPKESIGVGGTLLSELHKS